MNVVMVGITGSKFAGKDTAAGILMKLFGRVIVPMNDFRDWNIIRYSMADPIREIGLILGYTMEQMLDPVLKELPYPLYNMSWRQMAQKIGTDMFREQIDNEIWAKIAKDRMSKLIRPSIVVIPDIRFDNECQMVMDSGGYVLKILREGCNGDSHKSERGVDTSYVKCEIFNNGTVDDLEKHLSYHVEKMPVCNMLKKIKQ